MSRISAVADYGQSIWFDYIQRGMIWEGALLGMTKEDDLRGVTSNPAIFNKAIGGSEDYGPAVRSAVLQGGDAIEIFERIAIADIQLACDTLRGVYERTERRDGYVSLEVSPFLAHDTEGTIAQALRLWKAVARDNVMIKIPATEAGLPAIEAVIAEGVNVNVTLLFDVAYYDRVHERYIAGLERLLKNGGDLSRVASVASFFVSRIDAKVDKAVALKSKEADAGTKVALEACLGEVAIANAKKAYASYQRTVAGDRWAALSAQGAQTQRVLWASTGTKNKAYSDVLYVERLIGPDTVNTVPEGTFHAFNDHGEAASTLESGTEEALKLLDSLDGLGISLKAITDQLLDEGVVAFAEAFDELLSTVERRRREILGQEISQMSISAPQVSKAVEARLQSMRQEGFGRSFWAKDARLYGRGHAFDPEVSGFMGWIDVDERMKAEAKFLARTQDELKAGGYEYVVLMGMGGSSLAPEVFARTFGAYEGHPELLVLDSTVPSQVSALEKKIGSKKTAFIVASKSGSTTEPLAFEAYFFDRLKDGASFVAVTDPSSKLEALAKHEVYRRIHEGEPAVGGRYSALSNFGLVPLAAFGGDSTDVLRRAEIMRKTCSASVPAPMNPGFELGVSLGLLAKEGRDKLTIFASTGLSALGCWLEQLVAESTGKQGLGIIPVDGEQLGAPEIYGNDRVFAYFQLEGDADESSRLDALQAAGHPVLRFQLHDRRDIVQEMYRWEIATAVAGQVIGINPFDQPNVQESKDYTTSFLESYKGEGSLPEVPGELKIFEGDGVAVYADAMNAEAMAGSCQDLATVLKGHLGRVGAGDYVAINAYVEMEPGNQEALRGLRHRVRDQHRVATTLGFGPRFLHSTGQIHKGGPNSGVFLQITADDPEDLKIPNMGFSFGTLKTAQANGDFTALSKRGRRLLRVHFKDARAGLAALSSAL